MNILNNDIEKALITLIVIDFFSKFDSNFSMESLKIFEASSFIQLTSG